MIHLTVVGAGMLSAEAQQWENLTDADKSEGFNGEPHECEECKRECTCEYEPCVCCNFDW